MIEHPQYEYAVKKFPISADLEIQNWLNAKGKQGFYFVHASTDGGFQSEKVVHYTLMRVKPDENDIMHNQEFLNTPTIGSRVNKMIDEENRKNQLP